MLFVRLYSDNFERLFSVHLYPSLLCRDERLKMTMWQSRKYHETSFVVNNEIIILYNFTAR